MNRHHRLACLLLFLMAHPALARGSMSQEDIVPIYVMFLSLPGLLVACFMGSEVVVTYAACVGLACFSPIIGVSGANAGFLFAITFPYWGTPIARALARSSGPRS